MCAWQLCTRGPSPSSLTRNHQLNRKVALRWCDPNLTVPKPLLSRKSHLHVLLSQHFSHSLLHQTSLPMPIARALLFGAPSSPRSSHQRSSPFPRSGDWCHHCPSPAVTFHSCRAGSGGEKDKIQQQLLSPHSHKKPHLWAQFSNWGVTLQQWIPARRWRLQMESPSWLNAFQDWPDAVPS